MQQPQELEHVRHRYNPEHFHSKAVRILDDLTADECRSWYEHPCTKSLINSLEGDVSAIVLMWLDGGYSKEDSTDATVQRQAKARGMAQAINDILDHIKEIRDLSLEGENYSD
jgi:hypothetical protein